VCEGSGAEQCLLEPLTALHLCFCAVQGPGAEPVWRQLLVCLLDSNDPEVAQKAAAALMRSSRRRVFVVGADMLG
jgi:hypothetical protein